MKNKNYLFAIQEVLPSPREASFFFCKEVFPNPLTSNLSLKFQLEQQANVNILISDVYGNYLESSAIYSTGEHIFTFDNISSLQSGMLHYSVTLGAEVNTGTIIKL